MSTPRAIDVAGVIGADDASVEVARIWVTDHAGSTVLIDAGVLEDPQVFGQLMADTIRHAAKAYAAAWSIDEGAALQAIVDGAAAELRDQFHTITPLPEGRIN